jgi:hypothetical protein
VKIHVSLKSEGNNNRYFTCSFTRMIVSEFFLELEIFQAKVVEKIKTHILCSITSSRKSCCIWDNVEKYVTARQATDASIIQRMLFACWITKATNTHSEYVIFIAFPLQQWLGERTWVLRYTYFVLPCLCFVRLLSADWCKKQLDSDCLTGLYAGAGPLCGYCIPCPRLITWNGTEWRRGLYNVAKLSVGWDVPCTECQVTLQAPDKCRA